jgi:hypothetical protein
MEGSEKKPLLVTSKSETPRVSSMSSDYHVHIDMTCALFMECLTGLEMRMAAKSSIILLFQTSLHQQFLSDIPYVPQSTVRNLSELENFTSTSKGI